MIRFGLKMELSRLAKRKISLDQVRGGQYLGPTQKKL